MAAQILAASSRRSTGSAPDHVSLDQPRKVGEAIDTVRNEIPLVERPPAVGLIDRVGGFEP